jgi:hypothetical protein
MCENIKFQIIYVGGREVGCRLLNTVTWVPSQHVPCGICDGESAAVTGYPYKLSVIPYQFSSYQFIIYLSTEARRLY